CVEAVGHRDPLLMACGQLLKGSREARPPTRCRRCAPDKEPRIIAGLLGRCLLRRRRNRCFDDSTAETAITFVRDRILTGRHCTLRIIEQNPGGAIGTRLEEGGLVYLPVTYLDRASERCGPSTNQPMHRPRSKRRAAQ